MRLRFSKRSVFTGILLLAFFTSPIRAAASVPLPTDYAKIDAQIRQEVEAYHIPGMAVIVVDAENTLFSGVYGNCESIDTPFIIGSMSKSFTALSVLQLAEQGKLDLDAPISRYLDCSLYLKKAEDGDRITVRQLLNQTSGLNTYHKFRTARITDTYGTYLYANVNYGLLGEIIETVSKESYSDYVEKHIFAPLGMTKTSATLENSKADGLITGHRNFFGIPVAGEPDYPTPASWSQVAAGYISSSAADMGKYLQMYLNGGGDILGKDSIDAMFYDNVPQDETGQNFYGMGWAVSCGLLDEPVLNHSGLVENYTSNMFILPESGIGVVILVNMNDYLVGNNLLGNITLPLIGGAKQDLPYNPYILFHLLIDAVCLILILASAFPLISLKKWQAKTHGRRIIFFELLRHLALPSALLGLPLLLGFPLWLVYYFVKDLFFVLVISSALLYGTGIYKLLYSFHSHKNKRVDYKREKR